MARSRVKKSELAGWRTKSLIPTNRLYLQCLKLRGLPFTATVEDVESWAKGILTGQNDVRNVNLEKSDILREAPKLFIRLLFESHSQNSGFALIITDPLTAKILFTHGHRTRLNCRFIEVFALMPPHCPVSPTPNEAEDMDNAPNGEGESAKCPRSLEPEPPLDPTVCSFCCLPFDQHSDGGRLSKVVGKVHNTPLMACHFLDLPALLTTGLRVHETYVADSGGKFLDRVLGSFACGETSLCPRTPYCHGDTHNIPEISGHCLSEMLDLPVYNIPHHESLIPVVPSASGSGDDKMIVSTTTSLNVIDSISEALINNTKSADDEPCSQEASTTASPVVGSPSRLSINVPSDCGHGEVMNGQVMNTCTECNTEGENVGANSPTVIHMVPNPDIDRAQFVSLFDFEWSLHEVLLELYHILSEAENITQLYGSKSKIMTLPQIANHLSRRSRCYMFITETKLTQVLNREFFDGSRGQYQLAEDVTLADVKSWGGRKKRLVGPTSAQASPRNSTAGPPSTTETGITMPPRETQQSVKPRRSIRSPNNSVMNVHTSSLSMTSVEMPPRESVRNQNQNQRPQRLPRSSNRQSRGGPKHSPNDLTTSYGQTSEKTSVLDFLQLESPNQNRKSNGFRTSFLKTETVLTGDHGDVGGAYDTHPSVGRRRGRLQTSMDTGLVSIPEFCYQKNRRAEREAFNGYESFQGSHYDPASDIRSGPETPAMTYGSRTPGPAQSTALEAAMELLSTSSYNNNSRIPNAMADTELDQIQQLLNDVGHITPLSSSHLNSRCGSVSVSHHNMAVSEGNTLTPPMYERIGADWASVSRDGSANLPGYGNSTYSAFGGESNNTLERAFTDYDYGSVCMNSYRSGDYDPYYLPSVGEYSAADTFSLSNLGGSHKASMPCAVPTPTSQSNMDADMYLSRPSMVSYGNGLYAANIEAGPLHF